MERWRWVCPDRVDDRVAVGVGMFVALSVGAIPATGLSWQLGVPRWGVRTVGLLPDVAIAALVAVGFTLLWRRRQRLDALDLAVAGLVLLVGVLLAAGVVADPWGRAVPFRLQVLGARALVWGLVLLVALRSVTASPSARERVVRILLWVAGLVAAVAVVEALFPDGWEAIGNGLLGMHDVQRDVYGVAVPQHLVVRTPLGGRSLPRAGSLLFEYLQLGFWLLPAFGAALARFARAPAVGGAALVALLSAGVAASLGRAALGCAVVVFVLVLATRPSVRERRRLGLVGGIGAVVGVALAVPTGLLLRLWQTLRGAEASLEIHRSATSAAWQVVLERPLGTGLGTGFAASARTPTEARVAENAYLDVALQGGWPTLGAFVLVVVLLWWSLWRRRPWDDLAVAGVAGVVGLTLGGLVLHTWQMLETSWLVLALSGLALPRRP